MILSFAFGSSTHVETVLDGILLSCQNATDFGFAWSNDLNVEHIVRPVILPYRFEGITQTLYTAYSTANFNLLSHGSLGETVSIDYGVMCDTTVHVRVNRSVITRSKTKKTRV